MSGSSPLRSHLCPHPGHRAHCWEEAGRCQVLTEFLFGPPSPDLAVTVALCLWGWGAVLKTYTGDMNPFEGMASPSARG